MKDNLPKRPEKRNYQRLDLELPVRLEVDGQEIVSNTQNISCGGMFLPTDESETKLFNEEKELTAFITIPDECKVVKLSGRIRRVQRKSDFDPAGIAIQFSGLYDENFLEIDRYLKWKLLN